MKNIQLPVIKFMIYYAKEFGSIEILDILEKESIDSENEAKLILVFLDKMCTKVAEDAKNNIVVLNQVVHTTDAEKVCNEIEDYIENIGYENLFNDE